MSVASTSDEKRILPLARLRQRARLLKYVGMLLYTVFLFVLIGFAGRTTVEIANRARLLTTLSVELAGINDELVTEQAGEAKDKLKANRQTKKNELRQTQSLISVGALSYCGTVQGIIECVDSKKGPSEDSMSLIERLSVHIGSWSDETIFLILAVCCGAIGALLGGLRTDDFTLFRDLALGFASGFIVYLVIKGGKHVFLLPDAASNQLILNPYAYAFSGILVGLFTEKAYNILVYFTEEIDRRLRGAIAVDRVGRESTEALRGSTTVATPQAGEGSPKTGDAANDGSRSEARARESQSDTDQRPPSQLGRVGA